MKKGLIFLLLLVAIPYVILSQKDSGELLYGYILLLFILAMVYLFRTGADRENRMKNHKKTAEEQGYVFSHVFEDYVGFDQEKKEAVFFYHNLEEPLVIPFNSLRRWSYKSEHDRNGYIKGYTFSFTTSNQMHPLLKFPVRSEGQADHYVALISAIVNA